MTVDLLIKNGRVIDPSQGKDAIENIAVVNGSIIDANSVDVDAVKITVDAAGCIVIPGLIDAHQHINYHGADWGMHPDLSTIPYGITAVADAGTTGVSNYKAMLDHLEQCAVKYRLYLNASPLGQSTGQYPEPLFPDKWNIQAFEKALNQHGNKISGLKLRLSKGIVDDLKPLEAFQKIATQLGLPLLVHPTNPPQPQREILKHLKRGDIYCHLYQGHGFTILDEKGNVIPELIEARNRGVVLDSAHGMMNFNYEIAQKAMEQGVYPDVISSDSTLTNFGHKPMNSLVEIMSKYLDMGMPIYDIIERTTINPARVIGIDKEGCGSLKNGTAADIAIFRIIDGDFFTIDCQKNERRIKKRFSTMLTVLDGQILYHSPDFDGC